MLLLANCRNNNSIILRSLNFSNIFFRKSYYIELLSFRQLFFGSYPSFQSSEDHIDDSHSRLNIYSFLSRLEVESMDPSDIFWDSLIVSGLLFHPWAGCIIRCHGRGHGEIDNIFFYRGSSFSSMEGAVDSSSLWSPWGSTHEKQREECRSHTYRNSTSNSVVEAKLVHR